MTSQGNPYRAGIWSISLMTLNVGFYLIKSPKVVFSSTFSPVTFKHRWRKKLVEVKDVVDYLLNQQIASLGTETLHLLF